VENSQGTETAKSNRGQETIVLDCLSAACKSGSRSHPCNNNDSKLKYTSDFNIMPSTMFMSLK